MRRTDEELREATNRLLKMIDGYLAKEDQDSLRTDGSGLMTYAEIRQHIAKENLNVDALMQKKGKQFNVMPCLRGPTEN